MLRIPDLKEKIRYKLTNHFNLAKRSNLIKIGTRTYEKKAQEEPTSVSNERKD